MQQHYESAPRVAAQSRLTTREVPMARQADLQRVIDRRSRSARRGTRSHSKESMQEKQTPKSTYPQGFLQHRSNTSLMMPAHERLYSHAVRMSEKRHELHVSAERKRRRDEMKEASFRPKLVSKQLYARSSGERPEESLWHKLSKREMRKVEALAQKEN